MKANPLVSEGARLERQAIRNYLRRTIKAALVEQGMTEEASHYELVLRWVLARKQRYEKKKGGLGR